MEVLIVAKTHMKNGACVGGFELSTKKNVRLLTSTGENQPKNTEFEVGQVWEINYNVRPNLIAPHNEDILIQNKSFLRVQTNINSFLKTNAPIWRGSPNDIFQGKILFSTGQSGFVSGKIGLPTQSVGFWLPDIALELTILDDKRHYFYFEDRIGPRIYAFPYVGFKSVIEKIELGTLVRVSLARWWNPNENNNEKRCYCQLSGWYNDTPLQDQIRHIVVPDDLPF
jgi:hypothetical protein